MSAVSLPAGASLSLASPLPPHAANKNAADAVIKPNFVFFQSETIGHPPLNICTSFLLQLYYVIVTPLLQAFTHCYR